MLCDKVLLFASLHYATAFDGFALMLFLPLTLDH